MLLLCFCLQTFHVQHQHAQNLLQQVTSEVCLWLCCTACLGVFLSSPTLSLVTNSKMCVCVSEYECVLWENSKKCRNVKMELSPAKKLTATGSCMVQDQARQQWWSIQSALQPDRWCNSGTSNMCKHIWLSPSTTVGLRRSKGVCVRVRVYVRACVYVSVSV